MIKLDFNCGWKWRHKDSDEQWRAVTLPHDAAMTEQRSKDADAGVNTGWFLGGDYEYVKRFTVPEDYVDGHTMLEFEGVYHDAEVYINGQKAGARRYGYTNFYVPLDGYIRSGENEVRVTAVNSDQPNSRWYSGAGIYRPVSMWASGGKYIEPNGLKIRTLSVNPARVEVRVKTNVAGDVRITVTDGKSEAASASVQTDGEGRGTLIIDIPDAKLWSVNSPELYACVATFEGDRAETPFGIRLLGYSRERGLTINGERVILRGACIHSDNGILGARSYPEAEERKVRLLKENGYNAIRSAHNPCAKSLLDACDRLGMLVMDEYADMWYIHKNKYDYASHLESEYERDIADMVEKDYNHPSVIIYSLGNEVAETGEKRGIELFEKMRDVIKKVDADRPVTAGVNIFFNYLYALGFGQYSDKKAEKNPNKKVGSEFFNALAGKTGDKFMKTMAKLPGCDRKTRDCFAAMDVAGYNYGIERYEHDIKKYKDRIILGSETFCSDAYRFWEYAKTHPALIGDFVWAGLDYLGEVGVGSWEYREYAPDFLHGVGWMTAGSGRIDLIGNPLGEALYTRVAFELEDKPQIAVVPVSHTCERHSPSAWKFSNAIPSWSWNGLDGKSARVEVYSRAHAVELFINGKSVGKKKRGKNCRFDFDVKYRSGTVTAVAIDRDGRETGRNSLTSADDTTVIKVLPEKETAAAGEVCFVRLKYTDGHGAVKPLERGIMEIATENCELLAAGSACPYNNLSYLGNMTDTYYGEALAVVRVADGGTATVRATGHNLVGEGKITIK